MPFLDFSEPVEIIVDRYFRRKQFLNSNSASEGEFSASALLRAEVQDNSLPQIPCTIIRDSNGRAVRFIYGEISMLSGGFEADPIIWQEQLVRDSDGKVSHIITTYPSGHSVTTVLLRSSGSLSSYEYF